MLWQLYEEKSLIAASDDWKIWWLKQPMIEASDDRKIFYDGWKNLSDYWKTPEKISDDYSIWWLKYMMIEKQIWWLRHLTIVTGMIEA